MTGNVLKNYTLAAAFIVPTSNVDAWKQLKFNKIPANQVSIFENSKIKVEVKKSASPLVYKLPEIKKVTRLEFSYDVNEASPEPQANSDSKVASPSESLSTSQFPDDSFLRVGLVAKGEKTLNWVQKKIAANWVLELFKLAPESVGLDRIYFYNIVRDPNLVGKTRVHPKSDLMLEEIVGAFPFQKKINHILKQPLEVVAIWISIDGDDLQSEFVTTIEQIKLY